MQLCPTFPSARKRSRGVERNDRLLVLNDAGGRGGGRGLNINGVRVHPARGETPGWTETLGPKGKRAGVRRRSGGGRRFLATKLIGAAALICRFPR